MARSFNGSTDQIDCGPHPIALSSCLSVAVWVNMSSLTPAYSCVVGKFLNAGVLFFIYVKSTGKMAYYIGNGVGASTGIDPANLTIGTGAWHHLAFTSFANSAANAGQLQTFVDGISDANVTNGGLLGTAFGTSHLSIGFDPSTAGRNLGGSIADVAGWSCLLSTAEIASLAKGVIRPYQLHPNALQFWLPMDGYGAPALDWSMFGNNGVLTGTTFVPGPPLLSPLPPLFAPKNTTLKTPPAAAFLAAWALQRNIAIEGIAT